MTQEEKIIATAFTGKMFIDGSEMVLLYEYMEKKVGHGVIDLMLASKDFREELHKACEQDFIDMVSKEQPSLPPPNLDEAAEEYISNTQLVNDVHEIAIKEFAFKAGAEWMAGQGVTTEQIVGRTPLNGPNGITVFLYDFDGFEAGDKVVVQIRKK